MPDLQQLSHSLNAVWTLAAAIFVYLMHAGFGFYEAGMCRRKNTVDTLSHNLIILAIAIVTFWVLGFGVLFGNGNTFMGLTGFAPNMELASDHLYHALSSKPVALAVAFAFAMSFSDTSATLIAGAGAERIKFIAVTTLAVLICGFVFPVAGHWAIGGGWLTKLATPFYDTGSGFIHLAGGACSLAVILMLGPREGRFDEDDDAIEPSSMPLVFLGAFILWMGFLGFNAGLAMEASKAVGLVILNTVLAGGFGTVVAMGGAWILTGKAHLRTAIVGLLAANVAVTSPSAIVEPWAAATIGVAAGLATLASMRLWAWLHIDDPTEYLTMNLVGGVLGLAAVGLFASPRIVREYDISSAPEPGVFYGGGTEQLWTQLMAAGAIAAFSLSITLLACLALRSVGWLRVSAEEEEEGSDLETHGEHAEEEEQSGEDEKESAP